MEARFHNWIKKKNKKKKVIVSFSLTFKIFLYKFAIDFFFFRIDDSVMITHLHVLKPISPVERKRKYLEEFLSCASP